MSTLNNPRPKADSLRESRLFWCISENEIVNAKGWSCAPGNPDYWWFPTLHSSMAIGTHCFESIADAKAELRKKLNADLHSIQAALHKLDKL